jgi:hypothetical protein
MGGTAVLWRACVMTLMAVAPLVAQTATQRVTFQVIPLSKMSVSGNPTALVISSASAGVAPTPATASGGTYAITTNEHQQKISALLDAAMPDGVTLEVALAAPPGATSVGLVALGPSAADVVTGITPTTASALPISYRLSASASADAPTAQSRVVTFTILAAP